MSTTSSPTEPLGAVRRLFRSRDDRVIAGVCSGLARYFRIDPTIVRIAAVALLLFGGVGVVAYLAAWLLVPEDGETEPLLHRGIAVDQSRVRVIAGGILLVIAVLVLAGSIAPDVGGALILPLILGLGGLLLLVAPGQSDTPPARAARPMGPATADPDGDDDRDDHGDSVPGTAVTVATRPTAATAVAASAPAAAPAPSGFATPAYGGAATPPTQRMGPVAPPPRPPRPPRSPVGRIAVGLLLVGLAAVASVAALSPNAIAWDTELAILVIVAGAILAGAGVFGRAHAGLLIGFLVATVATVLIGSGLHLHGGVGDRVYRPGPGEPVASSYQLGVGQLRLDLRNATLPRTPTRISADLGVGRLLVIVPDDVRLTVNADNRVGNVELDTKFSEGTDVKRSITVGPLNGRPVVLDADVGIGSLEVRRGNPPWPTRDGGTISGALPSSPSTWSLHDHA